ncbi:MAG: iron-containing alcohol dehydrogenase [Deltaproteobacteria bacterium]|nr:iron-containing alcohol dehydrogenase [Deltaproteobacteria bacterium]
MAQHSYTFSWPTTLECGPGATARAAERVGQYGRRVLWVYGRASLQRSGLHARLSRQLAAYGLAVCEVGGIGTNPLLSQVQAGVTAGRAFGADVVFTSGGGSVMDAGKAMAAGIAEDADLWAAFQQHRQIVAALPIVALVTLPATGSEMNDVAVVTHDTTRDKLVASSPALYPRHAILDPELTLDLPLPLTMGGVADLISHVVELYFDGSRSPLVDRFGEQIVAAAIAAARRVHADPRNLEARTTLMHCATFALNGLLAFGKHGGDWSSHRIEHAMSALYDVHHGTGLAVVLPTWMAWAAEHVPEPFARFALGVFGETVRGVTIADTARAGILRLRAFYRDVGLPTTLEGLGLERSQIPALVEKAGQMRPYPYGALCAIGPTEATAILERIADWGEQ